MKTATATLVLAATLGLAAAALADMPGKDWMPAAQAKQKIEAQGYSNITEFEADDGHWEGEGIKNGVKMEFHADARTGEIISEKPDDD
jgi:uncharacterized membrane protein YkoI